MKLNPIYLFAPIQRVDEEARVVEGYAYVNETVPGEGGIKLKRSAMEAATPDYLSWGTVRSMHQPIAAGTCEGIEWDDKGAWFRARIVDDQEWRKVQEGVYKGFSVGVRAKVMRGKDVESAEWIETSLVDRPKDSDARIAFFRAEDDGEQDVELLPEEDAPDVERAEAIEEAQESAEELPQIDRLAELEGENTTLLERLSTMESELAVVRADLEAARERVRELEVAPRPQAAPVRFAAALERTFAANDVQDVRDSGLRKELAQLEADLPKEPDPAKRQQGVVRMQVIKSMLGR